MCNSAFAAFFETTPENIIGLTSRDIIDADIADELCLEDSMVRMTARPRQFHKHLVRHDKRHDFEFVDCPVFDSDGKIDGVLSVARDVTGRMELIDALRNASMLDRCSVGLALIDTDGRLTPLNQACASFFGFDTCWLFETHLSAYCFEEDIPQVSSFIKKASNGHSNEHRRGEVIRFRHRKGGEIWGRLYAYEIASNDVDARISGNHTRRALQIIDVTTEVKNERTIKHLQKKAIGEGQRLNAAVEREKARISRELHDELGQLLTALNFELNFLRKDLSDRATETEPRLSNMQELVSQSIRSAAHLSRRLRPPVLEYGLLAGLQWLTQETRQHFNIECTFINDVKEAQMSDLSDAVNTALFRVTQEALTNVARHSQATKAEVKFEWPTEEDGPTLTISDNGIGFNINMVRKRGGGVTGMHDRIGLLGGEMEVKSSNEGSTLRVRLSHLQKKEKPPRSR